ncbi:MAG TPA: DNA-binding response regulator, partial [Solirubrobacteraceae bacterium]|nr:DNA-binding response regulator [Solirubrobacteraceae bacterium]
MIDREPGFLQVLANRLDSLGWEHRALSTPVTAEALVSMRLNALVLDISVLGPGGWEYLER